LGFFGLKGKGSWHRRGRRGVETRAIKAAGIFGDTPERGRLKIGGEKGVNKRKETKKKGLFKVPRKLPSAYLGRQENKRKTAVRYIRLGIYQEQRATRPPRPSRWSAAIPSLVKGKKKKQLKLLGDAEMEIGKAGESGEGKPSITKGRRK